MTQLCRRCGEHKTQDQYRPSAWGQPGNYCNPCHNEYKRQAYRRLYPPKPKAVKPPKPPRIYSSAYGAVHKRLRKRRGSAAALLCVDCGLPADQWSWSGVGDVLTQVWNGKRVRYSLDLDTYEPRCRRCHALFDVRISRTAA